MNSAILPDPLAHVAPRGGPTLRLFGEPTLLPRGRLASGWPYAKLAALLAVLADAVGQPVRRDWLAALLWPEGDGASLRRALYDLRRLWPARNGRAGAPVASRTHLWLEAGTRSDVTALHAAWQRLRAGAFDPAAGQAALALCQGEFASGLEVPGADDFALWLMQARARWERRAVEVALALAEHHGRHERWREALLAVTRASELAPDDESVRARLWQCQMAVGDPLAAAQDWRRVRDLLAAQGLQPGTALRAQAARLGLESEAAEAASDMDDEALADELARALRGGEAGVEALLGRALAHLRKASPARPHTLHGLLLRRTLMLRLMQAPWHGPMTELARMTEDLLCRPLPDDVRVDLVQTLATWHGWMGRGLRGEVLVRALGDAAYDADMPTPTRVRWWTTLALCHSCSTGDPELSIRAARAGLKCAAEAGVAWAEPGLQMLVANAALNRDASGDADVSSRALAAAEAAGPLRHFDLVNHRQLSAQWQLAHGELALALALAEQGIQQSRAAPFPLQGLSCTLLAVSARLLLGENEEADLPLRDAIVVARRIGAQGYLMNALTLAAVLDRRQGQPAAAASRVDEARAIARCCGVRRIRKIPPTLLEEALASA